MSNKTVINARAKRWSEERASVFPRVLIISSDALFTHFFPAPVQSRLSEISDWQLFQPDEQNEADLPELIAQSDALITTWHSPFLRADWFGSSNTNRPGLIAHCGGEVKARMEEAVVDLVTVTNAPEPMAQGVAEMALAFMLMLVRKIPQYVEGMRAGENRGNDYAGSGESVRGRKVGVVGFGRIGRAFARMSQPLGVELFVSDPYCSPEGARRENVKLVELDELLSTCSVVILAAALTPETHYMLDARRLSLLSDGSYLINVGRGGLIEMQALIDELRQGRLTAALDVTDPEEPLPRNHILRTLPNVYLTPHIAAGGVEVRAAIGAVVVEEVRRFFAGVPVLNKVTREMLATMT